MSKELEEDDDEELDDELDDEEKLLSGSSLCDRVVLKRVIALRHANSVESTWACLNLVRISWKLRISVMNLMSFSDEVVSEFKPAWARSGVISKGI